MQWHFVEVSVTEYKHTYLYVVIFSRSVCDRVQTYLQIYSDIF